MADHLHLRKPARTYPSEVEEMVQRVATIRHNFLTNSPNTTQSLRSTIRDSWQRCITLLTPERIQAPIMFTSEAELQDLYLANELILIAASAVVKRLESSLNTSGYVVGLADARGCLLQISGDKTAIKKMETLGLTPGGDWSEAGAGTNGIGTALAVGHAVQVVGSEHFCEGLQDITCITVPIYNPWEPVIIGLLDISGDYHLIRPFFTGILTAASLEIKENIKHLLASPTETLTPARGATHFTPGFASISADTQHQQQPAPDPIFSLFDHDLQAQLNFQERRASIAEQLAIASGAVSVSLDFETTLMQVAQHAAHLLNLDNAAICLLDGHGVSLVHAWCKPSSHAPNLVKTIELLIEQSGVVNRLYESSEPITIDDVRSSAVPLPAKAIQQQGVQSLVLIPLTGRDHLQGFMIITRPTPYHWQPDDLRLELILSFHAATAIENARLYQTLQHHHRHTEALNTVNQLLHTLYDPTQQLELIIKCVVHVMQLDSGMILLERDDSILSAHLGLEDTVLTPLYELLVSEESLVNRQPSLVCALNDDENKITRGLQDLHLCDVITAPLTAGCNTLGILIVGSHQHHKLTYEDLKLLTNIGQQLGMAFNNAQLLRSAGEMQALREADRIKSRFLMMISHDLRSPLTAIRTSVESLLDRHGQHSANAQTQLLSNIAGQAKRLGGLVDQLLDLLRIEAGAFPLDRDWTELGALIVDTIVKFQRLNGACHIKHKLAPNLPLVYIDPDRMVQVIWNLLENAHKYSPPSAPIIVEALEIEQEIFIHVSDRGAGIPVEEHEKIFQYFYRLEREQRLHAPGSGLGLAICRGIINAHSGRIWVEDRPGGGCIFSIALPPTLADTSHLIALDNLEAMDISHS